MKWIIISLIAVTVLWFILWYLDIVGENPWWCKNKEKKDCFFLRGGVIKHYGDCKHCKFRKLL